MTNRTKGNLFEKDFCTYAANKGYYAHNNVQGEFGQPFDVQLCKNDTCYQIDCKVCDADRFPVKGIQPNQRTSFELLESVGCHNNFIVVKFENKGHTVFLPWNQIKQYPIKTSVPFSDFYPLERLWRL